MRDYIKKLPYNYLIYAVVTATTLAITTWIRTGMILNFLWVTFKIMIICDLIICSFSIILKLIHKGRNLCSQYMKRKQIKK